MTYYVEYFDLESKLRNVCVPLVREDGTSGDVKIRAALAIVINHRERDKSKQVSKIRMFREMHKPLTPIY